MLTNGIGSIEQISQGLPREQQQRLHDLYSDYCAFLGTAEREVLRLRGREPGSAAYHAVQDRSLRNSSLADTLFSQGLQEFGVCFGRNGYIAVVRA